MSISADWFRALPKVELHLHLDGSLRPATLLELADAEGLALPASTPEALARAILVRDAHNLEEYLDRYRYTVGVLQRPEALHRVARELVEDVAAENVRHVEARFCPALHEPAMRAEDAVEATLDGLARGERATGTTARLIVCGLRTLDPEVSERMAHLAVAFRERGVVAFDLAGAEGGHPARDHRAAFEIARRAGLGRTCHAGEGDGPDSIREALDLCHAERLGHGTRLHEDPELEARVLEAGIPLETCLTSNVHTRTVPDAASHPAARYLRRGHRVTLSTDGRLMDGVTLSDELRLAHEALGLSEEEILRILRNAWMSAFLSDDEKRALGERLERELALGGVRLGETSLRETSLRDGSCGGPNP